MKVGSLVMLTEKLDPLRSSEYTFPYITNIPVFGVIYTVREIVKGFADADKGRTGIRLEEMVVGVLPNGREISVDIRVWREVQPPMKEELKLLMEETQLEPA